MSLRDWVVANAEPSAHHLATRMSHDLLAVTRNSPTWEEAVDRDQRIAVMAAVNACAGESLFSTATRARAFCATRVEGDEGFQPALNTLTGAVQRAGGVSTSARDTARTLDALGHVNPQANWPSPVWVSLMTIPALVGMVLHAPLFAVVMAAARRLSADRSELMAKAIVPGLHLIFVGYVILSGLFALGFRAVGVSAWWALPLTFLLPRLGDLSVRWRDALSAM